MKKSILALLLTIRCVMLGSIALAENQYYTLQTPAEIVGTDTYTVTLAACDGWKWNISENTDVTSWLVTSEGTPAFNETEGVASGHLVYGAVQGEEQEVPVALDITIDASKITGFRVNGTYDLYVLPTGKSTLWVTGENHGQYQNSMEKIGSVKIPSVMIDGTITGNANGELELTEDSVKVVLTMDGLEDALINASTTEIALLDGDGYYTYQYEYTPGVLDSTWSNGESVYAFGNITGSFSPQGGDGNGHYDFRIGISGLRYNGLPLAQAIAHTDLYTFGRTFDVTDGSILWNTEPVWFANTDVPVLCDAYPDLLGVNWPISFDASALTSQDISVTLMSAYGDTLPLTPDVDFTVNTTSSATEITVSYIYWAYAPVYTQMKVNIGTEHVTHDAQMYKASDLYSHTYDIASVYAYSVMSGGPTGTQAWTYFGFENLTDASQVFMPATYTLTVTDADGNVQYFVEDDGNSGHLVATAAEATAFDCNDECDVKLEGQTVYYTRLYDQTEDKMVNGEMITLTKAYFTAETLPKNVNALDGLLTAPGYTLGTGWEDHLKWPWQSFVNQGFQGGSK